MNGQAVAGLLLFVGAFVMSGSIVMLTIFVVAAAVALAVGGR